MYNVLKMHLIMSISLQRRYKLAEGWINKPIWKQVSQHTMSAMNIGFCFLGLKIDFLLEFWKISLMFHLLKFLTLQSHFEFYEAILYVSTLFFCFSPYFFAVRLYFTISRMSMVGQTCWYCFWYLIVFQADPRFVWNRNLLEDLIESKVRCCFC